MQGKAETHRNEGLDLFRATAIGLVLLSHGRHFFTVFPLAGWNWWWLSAGGYLGVELFFVLSGFLIGRILLRELWVESSEPWGSRLGRFLVRRWLRTLPLYYLVLLAAYGLAFHEGHSPWFDWRHLLFLQNFHRPSLDFFGVSWSLAVEEWFYLVVPALGAASLAGLGALPRRSLAWRIAAFLVGLVLLVWLARSAWLWLRPGVGWTDMRKNVFLRFDSFAVGIAFAWLEMYRPAWFERLSRGAWAAAAYAGLLALVAYYYLVGEPAVDGRLFARHAMFFLTSLSAGGVMIHLARAFEIRSPTIRWMSKVSYAIYLCHGFIFEPLIRLSHQWANPLGTLGLVVAAGAAVAGVSTLLHWGCEQPFLRLRDRIAPSRSSHPSSAHPSPPEVSPYAATATWPRDNPPSLGG
jgi:peptidoglycan/LPS O-acetylase OafA/YrhL